jgi:SAM-dependent methyltransferase
MRGLSAAAARGDTFVGKLHRDAAYWDCGVSRVPRRTGAATLMEASDIISLCDELGIELPLPSLLDVGCGTGRASGVCADARRYLGLDITPSCVAFCHEHGIPAVLIRGASDVVYAGAEWTFALSLFTHMDRRERRAYLQHFYSPHILVDIIPGNGSGDVALWTANEAGFRRDLAAADYAVHRQADRIGPDGALHRYFWGRDQCQPHAI